MTTSLVAVATDVEHNGRRVVGYGFNSNRAGAVRTPGSTPERSAYK